MDNVRSIWSGKSTSVKGSFCHFRMPLANIRTAVCLMRFRQARVSAMARVAWIGDHLRDRSPHPAGQVAGRHEEGDPRLSSGGGP